MCETSSVSSETWTNFINVSHYNISEHKMHPNSMHPMAKLFMISLNT